MRKWVPFWTVPVLLAMAVGTVWLRLTIVRTTYGINQAEIQIRHLQQEKQQAELKVTALRSPRRLELVARTKFGWSQPRVDQVIHVGKLGKLPNMGGKEAASKQVNHRK